MKEGTGAQNARHTAGQPTCLQGALRVELYGDRDSGFLALKRGQSLGWNWRSLLACWPCDLPVPQARWGSPVRVVSVFPFVQLPRQLENTLIRLTRRLQPAALRPVSKRRALGPAGAREGSPRGMRILPPGVPTGQQPARLGRQAWTGCETSHARSCGARRAARPASAPEAAWHIRTGPRPAAGARHLLRGFPSFINELWQQPCELGLGWRHGL